MPYDAELHINYYIHMLLKVLYIFLARIPNTVVPFF